ncbi:MAG: ROK family protein [Nakamurella sp.]
MSGVLLPSARPVVTIGVDIGGTKIAAAVVESAGHGVQLPVDVRRAATPAGATAILQVCADLVDALRAGYDIAAIGVGAPGIIDTVTGTVDAASEVVPGWAGARIAATLQHSSGLPVRVENDVRAFARAELQLGAGRGFERCLYVAFGTGVGGALVLDGVLLDSPHSTVGEVAHLGVSVPGSRACGCGRSGHLEAVACGPAMAAEYRRRTGAEPTATAEDLGRAAAAGDSAARGVIADAARIAGEALAGVVSALDLEAIVVGGGAAEVHPDFVPMLGETVNGARWPRGSAVAVLRGQFGSSAPILGAALLGATAVAGSPVASTSGSR